eukprot:TRINITY_DN24310_c0_g1_i1.p1 TRINITY_DN24310_c0_g1~~TRINITY_DN24310_c0_g1_i1.p1  ORF type:complete len:360 (+),score=113.93 TRINITY_DN24310_c0_g1_i1:101-1180(+)
MSDPSVVRLKGCEAFRNRIVLATLSGRRVVIDDIRIDEENPGLRDFEASFLRLIEKVTNGCEIQINETGTRIAYKPGIILGGTFTHDCGTSRSMGYFLEPLIFLAPFGKSDMVATLSGISNEQQDPSVDMIRTVSLPLLKSFGLEGVELKILKRGAPPQGGGQVKFTCPIVRELRNVNLMDDGQIRRFRGIAYSTRVSPQIANRIVDAAKGVLTKFNHDVYIYTDHYKGSESGLSPGFALTIVAESTTGSILSAESTAAPGELPEEIGETAANMLLAEVLNRGFVDTTHQGLALLLMVVGPDAISKIRLGKLSPQSIQLLRLIKDFFGVTFKLQTDAETMTVACTCRGIGYKNLAKRIY